MFKIYFKQAIETLSQNKFISFIAVLGTALAIMMIMTIIVTDEIRSINIAPEINRDRTLYIRNQITRNSQGGNQNSFPLSYQTITKLLPRLEIPEYVSAVDFNFIGAKVNVQPQGLEDDDIEAILRTTDANYWHIFAFTFIDGKPFTQEEFQSGMPYAVVSESTAQKLFKGEEAVGKTIDINFNTYHIIGVVEDVSALFKHAYGDVWVPYTSSADYEELYYTSLLLAKSKKDIPAIMQEVRDLEKKYKLENEDRQIFLMGPEINQIYNLDMWAENVGEMENNITLHYRKKILIFLILLLIPAINLSGLSLSRIKRRTGEIGVRKAFGAKKYIILTQVLYENFITSLLGGIIGLILSYGIVFWLRGWLLQVPEHTSIPISSLISPVVFIAVFLICVLINLLSAGIPAYKASRMVIIDSITQNEQKK